MSDLENTTAISRVLENTQPTAAEVKSLVAAKPAARKPTSKAKVNAAAILAVPKQPAADASDAVWTAYNRAVRDWRAAKKAAEPRRTKAPVISNKVKLAFFKNATRTSELIAKDTGTKLSTVKTFRGDAVNTLAVLAGMPGSWLGSDAKKWLEVNRKK